MTMADESTKIEELLRVNAELAAEIRALSQGRTEEPRSGQIPAAREVARLLSERDSLAAGLEEAEAALAATRADCDRLEQQNREFAAEIARLSAALPGFLRRARGRLFSRGGGGAAPGPRGR
jgi:septal ring factor EnvC (AmiA/AmiB activator)